MKGWFKIAFILIGLLLVVGLPKADAQRYNKTRILFVLDGSYSMFGNLEEQSKIVIAKNLLTKLVDSLRDDKDVEMALRAYGHTSPKRMQDCKDTKLEVPFMVDNEDDIIKSLQEIKPKGTTPIAYSLEEAGDDFPSSRRTKNVIILLTDGIEECGGDPCAVSTALQKHNVTLKPFIIGMGISEKFKSQFNCVGRYFNAGNKEEFREALSVVVSQALNTTTTQVRLLDSYGKATETDVNMTFYDAEQDIVRYNYYHTMDESGNPDTLVIDPVTKYNIQVHTTPEVWKRNIELDAGKHNTININTPRGRIKLIMKGSNAYGTVKTLIKQDNGCRMVHEQVMNSSHKYLVGNYDLEIMTLPKIKIQNVKVKQDQVTPIEIPAPGNLYISMSENMLGSIYQIKNNKMEWVCNIKEKVRREHIVLQPGKYKIISRPADAVRAYETRENKFEVTSGGTTQINLK